MKYNQAIDEYGLEKKLDNGNFDFTKWGITFLYI